MASEIPSVGQVVTYYPRAGKPGRRVEVIQVTPNPFYRASVRFRYLEGVSAGCNREREVYLRSFHTRPF